jgi:hypothetical protein
MTGGIFTCAHCGQKNRIPASWSGRVSPQRPICAICKTPLPGIRQLSNDALEALKFIRDHCQHLKCSVDTLPAEAAKVFSNLWGQISTNITDTRCDIPGQEAFLGDLALPTADVMDIYLFGVSDAFLTAWHHQQGEGAERAEVYSGAALLPLARLVDLDGKAAVWYFTWVGVCNKLLKPQLSAA